MSRTRLDEIVEYEAIPVATVREYAMRVADRAFRHGVEQSKNACLPLTGHYFARDGQGTVDLIVMGAEAARKQIANVQPAPAESAELAKCGCPEKAHCFCYLDRRKGERRKGLEWRNRSGEFYDTARSVPYRDIDRRSGRDRRK